MKKSVLVIDSDYEEAEPFLQGLRETSGQDWEVWLSENNKIHGFRRYLRFFTTGWGLFLWRGRYSGQMMLCWQQFFGICFAFFCRLFHVKKTASLVIMTFIYKQKRGIAGTLFYRFVRYAVQSPYVDRIICTSQAEIDAYSHMFEIPKERFSFVRWGSLDRDGQIPEKEALKKRKYLFSVGRSNRDYEFLMDALKGTEYRLIIACDTLKTKPQEHVKIKRELFGDQMLTYMKNAWCVVIPLKEEGIAAGQLAFLQAMNLGVPVIVTRSSGITDDYVTDGYNGLVIEKNRKGLLEALRRLEEEPGLYETLSRNEKEDYQKHYTKEALGRNIGWIVKTLMEERGDGKPGHQPDCGGI